MPKRKHRGGSSDRPSARHDRADSSSPSRPLTGKAAFGKARPERHGSGKTGPAKTGWNQKPAHGRKTMTPQGRPRFDTPLDSGHGGRPRPERSRFAQTSPASSTPSPDIDSPKRPSPGQLWLYGLHAVKAALDNPQRRCHRLLLTSEATEALQLATHNINGLAPEIVDRDGIARILPAGAVHQGAALLTEPLSAVALEDVLDRVATAETSVIVILDQVTDPQNVGAILRSAAAFGADAVVVPDRHAPPETGALVKAASGASEIVPLIRVVNLARAMEDLKAARFWCAGLDGHAPQTLAAADMTGKVALVLGAEGEGLRRLTRDHCDILARLPISERMESLNVSAAAAVALYELARKA